MRLTPPHLIEQRLKAFRPQAGPEVAEGREIRGQLLDVQPQKPLVDQVKGGRLFNLAVQQIIKKLQKHLFEHQHRVPGVLPPIGITALAALLDKAKIQHLGQPLQKMGPWDKICSLEKIAEERTVGFAFWGHGRT